MSNTDEINPKKYTEIQMQVEKDLTRKAYSVIIENLERENAELKAKIADGIRVYVEYYEDEMFINETAVGKEMRNATLLLDEDWDK